MELPQAPSPQNIESAFALARETYAQCGVDAEKAVEAALQIPLSFHCWQADDITGLEKEVAKGGGIMATGNFPGRARDGDEMRQDFDQVLELSPGHHRLNIHAIYAETGNQVVDRDAISIEHFERWLDWGRDRRIKIDFNTSFFAHPKANDGQTLSHQDGGIRSFWVRHGQACRVIATEMARRQESYCTLNHWIPDGQKDYPADRWGPRARLTESLDAMLAEQDGVDRSLCIEAVESKLFGLGIEAFTVGSAEYYSSYALSRGFLYCIDQGHFHPTETIHDKFSAYLQFHDKLLIHLSRPMRWDSDHVIVFDQDLRDIFTELQRGSAWDRVYLATDFFDASVNRVMAYVIGLRAVRKAILQAFLDPSRLIMGKEAEGNLSERLALMEEAKSLPFSAVWDYLCLKADKPRGASWIGSVREYSERILSQRS